VHRLSFLTGVGPYPRGALRAQERCFTGAGGFSWRPRDRSHARLPRVGPDGALPDAARSFINGAGSFSWRPRDRSHARVPRVGPDGAACDRRRSFINGAGSFSWRPRHGARTDVPRSFIARSGRSH